MRSFFNFCTLILGLISFSATCQEYTSNDYSSYILTPAAPATPRINGPRVYGVSPGKPVIYKIPCTGTRPINFSIRDLPEGIHLDPVTGILTGSISRPDTYVLNICARNQHGEDCRELKIIVGDQLALTPPMGWNSWYIHYDRVSDRLMREAADQMVATGMADYGYQYINIDDCWMVKVKSTDPDIGGPTRANDGSILTNKRFPDMKAMTDYIHTKGLKAGLYISPGPSTCAGYEGSHGHERQDAETFSRWGFDFLKYDWCSYGKIAGGNSLDQLKKPYHKMWNILKTLDRDIVLNLCQYGMGDVWTWGAEVGNCWRTTGDLGLEDRKELPGFYYIGMRNAEHWSFGGPGGWNDPDYILIGWVGNAHKMAEGTPTDLTPHEQYSYMSMWSLMAAPLIFSGDMAKLDPFTLNVLCNHEVIDINQDPLGRQARIIRKSDHEFVLAKDMEDGSLALGIFNLQDRETVINVNWEDIGIKGSQRIRDVWRQADIGNFVDVYGSTLPPHGVMLVRLWP